MHAPVAHRRPLPTFCIASEDHLADLHFTVPRWPHASGRRGDLLGPLFSLSDGMSRPCRCRASIGFVPAATALPPQGIDRRPTAGMGFVAQRRRWFPRRPRAPSARPLSRSCHRARLLATVTPSLVMRRTGALAGTTCDPSTERDLHPSASMSARLRLRRATPGPRARRKARGQKVSRPFPSVIGEGWSSRPGVP